MTNTIKFTKERFADFKSEFTPLMEAHFHEVVSFPEEAPLDFDYETYLKLENAEILHCTTARVDGVLVGYALYLVINWLHSKRTKLGECVLFYLTKDARRLHDKLAYDLLIEAAGEMLKPLNVDMTIHRTKTTNSGQKIFQRLGHEEVELSYRKRIS